MKVLRIATVALAMLAFTATASGCDSDKATMQHSVIFDNNSHQSVVVTICLPNQCTRSSPTNVPTAVTANDSLAGTYGPHLISPGKAWEFPDPSTVAHTATFVVTQGRLKLGCGIPIPPASTLRAANVQYSISRLQVCKRPRLPLSRPTPTSSRH